MSTVVLPSPAADDCGDPRFEHETLPYLDRLYAAAHRMTGAAARAEELVERAFTRAYRTYRKSAPPAGDARTWLFRNLYSAWLDAAEEEVPAQGGGPGSPTTDAADAVRNAMDSLTPKVRFTVYLADVEGFSEAEIAEITGVPKGIAATRLHRAHGQLEARLEDWARHSAP
ncbi:sigma factor-like helix-turn-helix DNA-binding protein [Phaeacidiphilus oryzae]|uniref:sigma factor-like helix-turn-helix DNA-binding protein n=1 Tax=Phaeacidiphilus oryzae TaxID=348818 RepID=UPI0005654734|nr:sigma factor-like helix-turn-helix DNA-binding protein [Phaeacidiphilus oryzae]